MEDDINNPLMTKDDNRDRKLTEELLKSMNDKCNSFITKAIIIDDWSEAICGWKEYPPYPKYTTSRKRKPTDNSDYIHGVIKCLNDDDSDHFIKPWCSNVESLTYRYIPNNGHYRFNKWVQSDIGWYTIFKTYPEKVQFCEKNSKSERPSRSKIKGERKKCEMRSRSTNSDSALNLSKKSPKIMNIKPNYQSDLSKSASDLYIETSDSKLLQIEKHVKKNRQREENMSMTDSTVDLGGKENILYRIPKKTTVTFNMKPDSSDLVNDASSLASSNASKNLKPLEKVTPKQRNNYQVPDKNISKSNHCQKTSTYTKYLSLGSSITIEGIESDQSKEIDKTEELESLLLGKGNKGKHYDVLGNSVKTKGTVLRYTTSNNFQKSKDKIFDQSITSTDVITNCTGDLPEVAGKQISVTFGANCLLRQ